MPKGEGARPFHIRTIDEIMSLEPYDRLKTLRQQQGNALKPGEWTPEMARELVRLESIQPVYNPPEYTQRAYTDQGRKADLSTGQKVAIIDEEYKRVTGRNKI